MSIFYLSLSIRFHLHCIKSQRSTKIRVSITSSDNVFTIEDIFKSDYNSETDDFNGNDGEENIEESINLSVGEWVLVNYDNTNFRGEVIKVVGEECEVVMHKSGKFWKWPQREDKIFYNQKSVI